MNTENYQRTIIAPKDSLLKREDVERDQSAVIHLQRLEMQTNSWRIAQHCWHSTEWALYLKPFCLRARLKMFEIMTIEYSLGSLTAKTSHLVCSWTAFRNLVSMCLENLLLKKLSRNVSKTDRLILQFKNKPLKQIICRARLSSVCANSLSIMLAQDTKANSSHSRALPFQQGPCGTVVLDP